MDNKSLLQTSKSILQAFNLKIKLNLNFKLFTRCLKMLGLCLYTLIIGHKYCNMFSILNKLTLQKELQNFVTNNVLFDKTLKNTKTAKQKIKHKNACRSRELNPGPLAPKAGAIPLHHRETESINCSHAI